MIIVTGSGRSGTSMWMQALKAAGVPVVGSAFGGGLHRLRSSNPRGFYESMHRDGNFAGVDLVQYQGHAIKIFPAGVRLVPAEHVENVICSIRDPREVASSYRVMGHRGGNKAATDSDAMLRLWWRANVGTVMDAWRRGYPFKLMAYESALAAPADTIVPIVQWLGQGDAAAAAAVVEPRLRRHVADTSQPIAGIEADDSAAFDALYAAAKAGAGIDSALMGQLVETQRRIHARRRAP